MTQNTFITTLTLGSKPRLQQDKTEMGTLWTQGMVWAKWDELHIIQSERCGE
jgi:hypothetical protein